jgi:hypothetical protein
MAKKGGWTYTDDGNVLQWSGHGRKGRLGSGLIGVQLETVIQLMGHKERRPTGFYIHLDQRYLL